MSRSGLPYDSDIELVRRVLMEIALANPNVLKAPPPKYFYAVCRKCDSVRAQAFCLYDYGRMLLLDELHRAVFHEFGRHGITIAFPQLDVHIDPGEQKSAESRRQPDPHDIEGYRLACCLSSCEGIVVSLLIRVPVLCRTFGARICSYS